MTINTRPVEHDPTQKSVFKPALKNTKSSASKCHVGLIDVKLQVPCFVFFSYSVVGRGTLLLCFELVSFISDSPPVYLLFLPVPLTEFSRESLLDEAAGLKCPLPRENQECSDVANVPDRSPNQKSTQKGTMKTQNVALSSQPSPQKEVLRKTSLYSVNPTTSKN